MDDNSHNYRIKALEKQGGKHENLLYGKKGLIVQVALTCRSVNMLVGATGVILAMFLGLIFKVFFA